MTQMAFAGGRLRQLAVSLLLSPTGVLIATTMATLLSRMVSSVVLTRLLAPDTYGLVGIIGSIFFAIALLTDLGFQAYVVRHPDGDDQRFQDAIWTIHAGRGLLLASVGAAAAPVASWILGKSEITWPMCVASATFAIDGVASLTLITMLRTNRSRTLSLLDLVVTVFQSVTSILLALVFRNVWAIIGSMIVTSLFKTAASYWIADRAPHKPVLDRGLARDFWAFSKLIMVSGFVTILIGQVDKFALARLFSLAQFGLYTTATTLAMAPQAIANSYMLRILYPLYARSQHEVPDQISRIYYSSGRHMIRLYWLGGGALVGGGPLIVKILYDPRYLAAGTYLSLLGISTLLTMSNKVASGLLLALGNTRFTLATNVLRLAWITLTMPLGFWLLGTVGIVASFGTIELPVYLYSALTLARLGIYRWRSELVYFAIAGAGCLAALALAELVARFVPQIT